MERVQSQHGISLSNSRSVTGYMGGVMKRLWPFTSSSTTTEQALRRSEEMNRAILGSLHE